jgi:hypothetical protein
MEDGRRCGDRAATPTFEDEQGNETRRHRGVTLAKAKMRKWEATDKLRGIITAAAKFQPRPDSLTLEWFTRERFLPMRQAKWAPSTRETNLYHLDRHILPALGSTPLRDLEKFHCQMFLNKLAAQNFSFTVVDRCRTMLKAILEEALDAELVNKNPARKLDNPETSEPVKPVLPKMASASDPRDTSLSRPTDRHDCCFLRHASG